VDTNEPGTYTEARKQPQSLPKQGRTRTRRTTKRSIQRTTGDRASHHAPSSRPPKQKTKPGQRTLRTQRTTTHPHRSNRENGRPQHLQGETIIYDFQL